MSPGVSVKEYPRSVFSKHIIRKRTFKNRFGARVSDSHRSEDGL